MVFRLSQLSHCHKSERNTVRIVFNFIIIGQSEEDTTWGNIPDALGLGGIAFLPAEYHVTRRELLTPIFSLGWEREDWNICLTFRLFRGLSKGLVSLLPESEC